MISGYFDPNYSGPLPMVRVGLFLPQITSSWVPIDFLLDTGADATVLHPQDALFRVGIDPTTLDRPDLWPNRQPMGGVGGAGECYIHPAHYAFRHDDGRLQTLSREICIARPDNANQTLESLLGWDVLQQFRVSLDWPGHRIELH